MIRLDVESVVRARLGKRTPKFVINYLKHIVHEDTFNQFFEEHPDLRDYDFLREVVYGLLEAKVTVNGLENIPKLNQTTTDNSESLKNISDKKLLFVSNHPLGGLDGMIIALLLGESREYNLRVIVNDLLMNLKPLEGIFVPVRIGGGQNREYAKRFEEIYESDYDILTFPSGKCSRLIDGKIQDPEWKKNFIQKSVQHKRDIVPIRFEGQNSNFFYKLALWRTRLHIKQNIEMLYLADEMFRQKGNHFTITVGQPISYTTFDNSRTPQQWAAWLREQVYQL